MCWRLERYFVVSGREILVPKFRYFFTEDNIHLQRHQAAFRKGEADGSRRIKRICVVLRENDNLRPFGCIVFYAEGSSATGHL